MRADRFDQILVCSWIFRVRFWSDELGYEKIDAERQEEGPFGAGLLAALAAAAPTVDDPMKAAPSSIASVPARTSPTSSA